MCVWRKGALPLDCKRALERLHFIRCTHAEKPKVRDCARVIHHHGGIVSGYRSNVANLWSGANELRSRRPIGGSAVKPSLPRSVGGEAPFGAAWNGVK